MSRVAVGYIRASTTDQALTPSVQLQRIKSWCESNNHLEMLVSMDRAGFKVSVTGGKDEVVRET